MPGLRMNAEKRVVSGEPAEEIIKFAKKDRTDLIVRGSHGRKGVEYTLFGSVAARQCCLNNPRPLPDLLE